MRRGAAAARRLGVRSRHVCRDLLARNERPRAGHGNAELAARAVQDALNEAGLHSRDLAYLIGHTAAPGKPCHRIFPAWQSCLAMTARLWSCARRVPVLPMR